MPKLTLESAAADLAKIIYLYLDYLEPQWNKSNGLIAMLGSQPKRKRQKPSPVRRAVLKELKRLKDADDQEE